MSAQEDVVDLLGRLVAIDSVNPSLVVTSRTTLYRDASEVSDDEPVACRR